MIDTRQEEAGLIGVVADAAADFASCLRGHSDLAPLAAPDFAAEARRQGTLQRDVAWTNDLRSGPGIRQAHVEYFAITGQIAVLHVCICPAVGKDWPIFGFDLIAGRHKATGVFMDLSPTGPASRAVTAAWADMTGPRDIFGEERQLPDWALEVFSPYAIAARPQSAAQVRTALRFGREAMAWYLAGANGAKAGDGRAAQQAYACAQRRNEHTFRMLARAVGTDVARDFIETWLFPDPCEGFGDDGETNDAV